MGLAEIKISFWEYTIYVEKNDHLIHQVKKILYIKD